ncbi:hypothetical protein R83H12_02586 [Fibrobacteria bacterium R8-3-H12]
MTRAMKSLASIVKSSLKAGLSVSFNEEELKSIGISLRLAHKNNSIILFLLYWLNHQNPNMVVDLVQPTLYFFELAATIL